MRGFQKQILCWTWGLSWNGQSLSPLHSTGLFRGFLFRGGSDFWQSKCEVFSDAHSLFVSNIRIINGEILLFPSKPITGGIVWTNFPTICFKTKFKPALGKCKESTITELETQNGKNSQCLKGVFLLGLVFLEAPASQVWEWHAISQSWTLLSNFMSLSIGCSCVNCRRSASLNR